MTPEQVQKAELAILRQKLANIEKMTAYKQHLKAVSWVDTYNLPYRVALDYIKQHGEGGGIVYINRCYPLPGYPINGLIEVYGEDLTDNEPNEDLRQRIEENNKQFHTWDLKTKAGLKEWEKQFAHFLAGYDVLGMTNFDITGDAKADPEAAESRKKYYVKLQQQYKKNPDAFRTSEPEYKPEYAEQYTTNEFIRLQSESERQQILAIAYKMGVLIPE